MSSVGKIAVPALASTAPYPYAAAVGRLVLTAGACPLDDVVKTTVYVASAERTDLTAAWDVVSAAFGDPGVPSTLLGVAALGYPGQLVEVEAVAVRPV